VRIGNRVDNFALYDTDGKVFELTRHARGKLVLLDFWFADCSPCRRAIPKLNKLQADYGRFGLQVIGVTYEQGTLPEKQQALATALRQHRLNINYKLLFGGGGNGPCPVAGQLQVHRYPTLVLLDATGRIIWRRQGLDDYSEHDLKLTIHDRLFPRRVAGSP
jgi:thiol-disulfide isomerase/thioredoxin